jgi:hypothetical protein
MTEEKPNKAQVKKALHMWLKFIRAYSMVNKKAADHLKSFGLTTSQYNGYRMSWLSRSELGQKTFLSTGSMTSIVDGNIVERF